jgi:hypothetical protein
LQNAKNWKAQKLFPKPVKEHQEQTMINENKKKHTQTFEDFDKANTDNWPPPKYLVQPAKGDKGFALAKSYFHRMTTHFKPGIKDADLDLPEDK